VVRELREEAKLESVGPAVAVALLFDPTTLTWEIVHRLRIDAAAIPEIGWEYDEFRMVAPADLPGPSTEVARRMQSIAARVVAGAQARE